VDITLDVTGILMVNHFEILANELHKIKSISSRTDAVGFYGQEVLRFHSIAGTVLDSFTTDENASVDERYITHVLARSLMENFFRIIYIFDDPAQRNTRYQKLVDSFKRDYCKLYNEPQLPQKGDLEPADSSWLNMPRLMDVNSLLAQLTNDYGGRLTYLYFIYRITSFDTHGNNLGVLLQSAFGKQVNFPILKIGYAFDLVANQYLVILNELKSAGEI
jgi:hypothetical protein